MARTVYLCLVLMHPPGFRRRFGDEMLFVFEEAACGAQSTARLLVDALLSALRQWLLSPATLTVAAALVGGLIPILVGLACTGQFPLKGWCR
jgi:hypothetical protein